MSCPSKRISRDHATGDAGTIPRLAGIRPCGGLVALEGTARRWYLNGHGLAGPLVRRRKRPLEGDRSRRGPLVADRRRRSHLAHLLQGGHPGTPAALLRPP